MYGSANDPARGAFKKYLEVTMMKKLSTARCIRKTLIFAVAVAVMTLPLLTAASTLNATSGDEQNTKGNPELTTVEGQKQLYKKLKAKSRKTCGPTNMRAAGSLERASANKECYEDTLAIAVLRLNNAAITALHQE
jgi:UrcA family protein